MKLPQYYSFIDSLNIHSSSRTVCIAMRAPIEVPVLEDSYCWIPSFDEEFNRKFQILVAFLTP
jgi:hypothetical protein